MYLVLDELNIFLFLNLFIKLFFKKEKKIQQQNFQFKFLILLCFQSSTKDDYLEIKLYDRHQVDNKIAWGLGRGFLYLHSSFVC